MRRSVVALLFGFAVAGGCTIDFDRFQFTERDATGGSSGSATGGKSGSATGGSGGSVGGTSGAADALSDAPRDQNVDVSADGDAATDGACAAGTKVCGGACVAIDDPAYGCGPTTCTACSLLNATAKCGGDAGAQCVVDTCSTGFGDCDGLAATGCEANIKSDPNNCNGCGNACSPSGSTYCDIGVCKPNPCPSGFMDCDGDPSTVCETNVQTSNAHCGFCNNPCAPPNATGSCQTGVCKVTGCNTNFANCDNLDVTGCEIDLTTSPDNCGSCSAACSTSNVATPGCLGGLCTPSCAAGFSNCNPAPGGSSDDGCETATATDTSNCGGCGTVCDSTNGTATCSGSVCSITCNLGFGDCDINVATGCETNIDTSASHCGSCGAACSTQNSSAQNCVGGLCQDTCNAGFTDCNGPQPGGADDGCETNTNSDPNHCGLCTTVCNSTNGTATCGNGQCGINCNTGFSNCDANLNNGCETATGTDVFNCGACGRGCSATQVLSLSCSGGLCTSTCNLGFANCTQPAAPTADNGCETGSTNSNCGGCNNSCADQSSGGGGLVCGTQTTNLCDCGGNDARCRQGSSTGTCDSATKLCRCSGTVCKSGEACVSVSGNNVCSCNGGAACTGSQVCCDSPAGCKDLTSDASSCGACGHACPSGLVCQASVCRCTTSSQCNAGSTGTVACNTTTGNCVCNGTTCVTGKRCLSNGSCG